MIPLPLMDRIIDLLESLIPSKLENVTFEHAFVLELLSIKKLKLELREVYSNMISADNEDDRHDARIDYLRKKRELYDWLHNHDEILS